MKPEDWVRSGRKLVKTDFEHHNFGGGEPDIVDPAWDLASAIFEFRLPPDAEQTLLETYVAQTADADVADRLPLYKILYAMNALRAAKYWIARKPNDAIAARIGTGSSPPHAALQLSTWRATAAAIGPCAGVGTAALLPGSGRRAGLGAAGFSAHHAVRRTSSASCCGATGSRWF